MSENLEKKVFFLIFFSQNNLINVRNKQKIYFFSNLNFKNIYECYCFAKKRQLIKLIQTMCCQLVKIQPKNPKFFLIF